MKKKVSFSTSKAITLSVFSYGEICIKLLVNDLPKGSIFCVSWYEPKENNHGFILTYNHTEAHDIYEHKLRSIIGSFSLPF